MNSEYTHRSRSKSQQCASKTVKVFLEALLSTLASVSGRLEISLRLVQMILAAPFTGGDGGRTACRVTRPSNTCLYLIVAPTSPVHMPMPLALRPGGAPSIRPGAVRSRVAISAYLMWRCEQLARPDSGAARLER